MLKRSKFEILNPNKEQIMRREELRKEIVKTIEARSILKHPFYVKWNEGKLSINELAEYAKQYYKFVEHFPMFVSAVHSNCPEAEVRKIMLENLADEEGFKTDTENHPRLWLNFCKSLGVEEDSVAETETMPEVAGMVDGFYEFCRSADYRSGLAALLAYEYQIPEVSRIKIEGLKKFYGIDSAEAIEFFTVHESADVYHSKAELDVLLEKCIDEKAQKKVLEIIDKAAGLYWKMLDGVYVS